MTPAPVMRWLHRHSLIVGCVVPSVFLVCSLLALACDLQSKKDNPWVGFAAWVGTGAMLAHYVRLALDRAKEWAEKDEKAAERREVIRATLAMGTDGLTSTWVPVVQLYNEGRCRVNVSDVRFVVESGGKTDAIQFFRDGDIVPVGGGWLRPMQHQTAELEPKQSVVFKSTISHPFDWRDLVTLPTGSIYIEVRSFEGVVATLRGVEFEERLKSMIPAHPSRG